MLKENVVVLYKTPLKEHNLIVTFFSATLGKIQANIPAATKSKSKNFFPYSIGDIIELIYSLKKADWIQIKEHNYHHQPQKFNLCHFLFVNIIHEFLIKYSVEEVEKAYFFDQLEHFHSKEWSHFSDESPFMFAHFVELSKKLGHQLNIDHCQTCGSQLIQINDNQIKLNKKSYCFSYEENGLLCSSCVPAQNSIPSWFLKLYYLAPYDQERATIPNKYFLMGLEYIIDYFLGSLNIKLSSTRLFLNEIKKAL